MRASAGNALLVAFSMWFSLCNVSTQFKRATVEEKPSKVVCEGRFSAPCGDEEFRKNGKPLMTLPLNGVAFGVSASPTDPTAVFVWMDNQTDQTQDYFMACNVTFLSAFFLYDSAGNLMLTQRERNARQPRNPGDPPDLEECSCCIFLAIAPHTLQVVDRGDLKLAYSPVPGTYSLVPVNHPARKSEALRLENAGPLSFAAQKNSLRIVIPPDAR